VYFRHGAKSEPGTTDDLRGVLDRAIREERDHLLANVRRVFEAPVGHQVVLVPADGVSTAAAESGPVRLTNDPAAPAVRATNPDELYPHRQKEVVAAVNARLGGATKINGHDVQCVRKVHGIDGSRPEFIEKRKYGSAQYSEQFIDWLVAEHGADPSFFAKARAATQPHA
jgi:hypothetical protein